MAQSDPARGVALVRRIALGDLSPRITVPAAALAALAWCIFAFGTDFLRGIGVFWDNPRGLMGFRYWEPPEVLASYYAYINDVWRFPLFDTRTINPPEGLNVVFADVVPWLALVGKLLRSVAGIAVNPYGFWTVLGFCGAAGSMTWLCARLGARSALAAAAATIVAVSFPALLMRWGHIALMGQFLVPLALVFYSHVVPPGSAAPGGLGWRLTALGAALAGFALLSNLYLAAMVLLIIGAADLQAVLSRRASLLRAAASLAVIVFVVLLLMVASGHFGGAGVPGGGFGKYSFNLASPFALRPAALNPLGRLIWTDATGGQTDGVAYLGLGLLALARIALPAMQGAGSLWRRHPVLSASLAACVLFATSHVVWFGTDHLGTIPLPFWLFRLFSYFRASGRFIWPALYLLAAWLVARQARRGTLRAALILACALALQWADTAPLRAAMVANIRGAPSSPYRVAAWESAMRRHRVVHVVPSIQCLSAQTAGWNLALIAHAHLMATRSQAGTNGVVSSHPVELDCAAERETARAAAGDMQLYLRYSAGLDTEALGLVDRPECSTGGWLILCSTILTEPERLALLQAVRPPAP